MGVEKLAEAAIMIVITKGILFTPKELARDIATGNISTAAASLVISSVNIHVDK
jgi:hypothetical protein